VTANGPGYSAVVDCSARLGQIAPAQFQAALDRFDLGKFIGATPIPFGLFGQNVFLTSTAGEFVLRGCPHYPWQFPCERFFARLLHERSATPVPWPYLIDHGEDIFGWSYVIMPRMPGLQLADPAVRAGLSATDQLEIAQALGTELATLQEAAWPCAGRYDLAQDTIQPFGQAYFEWAAADTRRWLALARAHDDRTTQADADWVEGIIEAARPALQVAFQPCVVLQDYKEANLTVSRRSGAHENWRVTGVFDLMEAFAGDGEADLVRSTAGYLDYAPALARAFVDAYFDRLPQRPGFAARYALYMLRDRLIYWEYFHRPGQRWKHEQTTLPDWAGRYLDAGAVIDAEPR